MRCAHLSLCLARYHLSENRAQYCSAFARKPAIMQLLTSPCVWSSVRVQQRDNRWMNLRTRLHLASSCLSVVHGTTRLPLGGFSWNFIYMRTIRKSDEKVQVLLNYDKNNGYFIWRQKYIYYISLNSSSTGNVIDNSWRENQNTHLSSIPPPLRKSGCLWLNPYRTNVENRVSS